MFALLLDHSHKKSYLTFYPCLFHKTILTINRNIHSTLVYYLLTKGTGYPAQHLFWLHLDIISHAATTTHPLIAISAATVVCTMPIWVGMDGNSPSRSQRTVVWVKFALHNVKMYVFYRFSFYDDGFMQMKSLSDTRSVTSLYILPLGLSYRSKKESSAFRVIFLVRHGENPNHVLDFSIDDVVNLDATVIELIYANTNPVFIFLYLVVFFGNCQASA